MSAEVDAVVDAEMDAVVRALAEAGLDPGSWTGSGMEADVVALRDGTVAKVWSTRGVAGLRREQAFHDAVAAAGLPFAVPGVLEVRSVRVGGVDRAVSVMPHLPGTPLWDRPGESPPLTGALLDAVATVLDALAAVRPDPALASLPLLGDEPPFSPAVAFGDQLADLVVRRTRASYDVLVAAVPDVGDLAALVVDRLRALEVPRPALVHGDLVPANVLVDAAGEVTAVLDLGFLTTLGDPAFDAAVTASITDMYGARARRTEEVLDARLGHPADRVATHRLAYALVTATVYSVSGSDGHAAWCVEMLRRPDLRDLVGAPPGPG